MADRLKFLLTIVIFSVIVFALGIFLDIAYVMKLTGGRPVLFESCHQRFFCNLLLIKIIFQVILFLTFVISVHIFNYNGMLQIICMVRKTISKRSIMSQQSIVFEIFRSSIAAIALFLIVLAGYVLFFFERSSEASFLLNPSIAMTCGVTLMSLTCHFFHIVFISYCCFHDITKSLK